MAAGLLTYACAAAGLPVATEPEDAGDAGAEASPLGQCANDCELRLRPRLLVGLYPDDARAAGARLTFQRPDGTLIDISRASPAGVCPSEIPEGSCSFYYYTLPTETVLQLTLEDADDPPLIFDVTLRPYNACSRDIAYVPVYRNDAGVGWTAGTTRYLSPCNTL